MSVAVVIPYRAVEQPWREAQLSRLLERLSSLPVFVVVAEQARDGLKFNRGALLNAGFLRALELGVDSVIFHDADLIPSDELLPLYTEPVRLRDIQHLGHAFSRYRDNPKYLGGVVHIHVDDYRVLNGFPNVFWGWGGEDDELSARVQELSSPPYDLRVSQPQTGSYLDLEEKTLETKLQELRDHPEWKCLCKRELLEIRPRYSGLADLRVELLENRTEEKLTWIQVLIHLDPTQPFASLAREDSTTSP